MIGYLIAGGYVVTSVLKHSWNPLHWFSGSKPHPTEEKALSPGLVYALNVITNTSADATQVQSAINAINGGQSFSSAGRIPALGKAGITSFPGVSLAANFNGKANQWIVYVLTKQPVTLPLQPAPTLLITSAFRAA